MRDNDSKTTEQFVGDAKNEPREIHRRRSASNRTLRVNVMSLFSVMRIAISPDELTVHAREPVT